MKHGRKNIHLVTLITESSKVFFTAENLPTELRVLKSGDNESTKGIVRVGNKTRTLLPLNQKQQGFDRIALDFEHNTVPGTRAYKESSEPRPVAAYGVAQLRDDGIWLTNLDWTPDGVKNARNFIDLSPAPSMDENNEVIFLHSVALCRQGSVFDLSIFSVELNSVTTAMEDELMDKLLAALRKAYNLAETATENDIAAALAAGPATFTTKLTDLEGKITTLTIALEKGKPEKGGDAGKNDLAEKVTILTTDFAGLKSTIVNMQSEIERRDRDALVALASREGKVIPLSADEIGKTPIKTLSEMVSKLAVTVPLAQRTPSNVQEFSVGDGNVLTDQDRKFAKSFGFSEEDVKKANNIK